MSFFLRFWPILCIVLIVAYVARGSMISGTVPLPADALVGMYHPFRDFYAAEFPRGVPVVNPLTTDPVQQQYPWRHLAIEALKQGELPFWNPYVLAGMPLLANHQSAILYPLNIIFFVMPFMQAWSVLVYSQPLLAALGMYLLLRTLGIGKTGALGGGIVYAFGGFATVWMQWNTLVHAGLWLPWALTGLYRYIALRKSILWLFLSGCSLSCSLFAGHLQTFVYVFFVSVSWAILLMARVRQWQIALAVIVHYLTVGAVTCVQWYPLLELISQSARSVDLTWQSNPSWFLPYSHLLMFISPDIFGNPVTQNYWGVWNYAEFSGYAGIIALSLSIVSAFTIRRKVVWYAIGLVILSLSMALPTPLGMAPFIWQIPFIDSAQPTRLLFVVGFGIALLAGIGIDRAIRSIRFLSAAAVVGVGLVGLAWVLVRSGVVTSDATSLSIAVRNLTYSSLIAGVFALCTCTVYVVGRFDQSRKWLAFLIGVLCIGWISADSIRYSEKFLPESRASYVYPSTRILTYLAEHAGYDRVMPIDKRILFPNIASYYRIATVSGYDPLYLYATGEMIAASERGDGNSAPPFGFNRIIAPSRFSSPLMSLLGVRYVLSLTPLNDPELTEVMKEGESILYRTDKVMPRAFMVPSTVRYAQREKMIKDITTGAIDLQKVAPGLDIPQGEWSSGSAEILMYSSSRVVIRTDTEGPGMLVLTDSWYPTWTATVDGQYRPIYQAYGMLRAVEVPPGVHTVEFRVHLW